MYKMNHDQIMLAASSMNYCLISEAFCPFNHALSICGLSADLLKSFLLAAQSAGRERCQMKVSPIFPLKFRTKALCKVMFQRTLTNTVQYSVEKQHVSILCLLHS